MELADLVAILTIIVIDVVLSGDNAVVIAMAAHRLPEHQRKQAILWGGGIAIFLRIVFTMVLAFILNVPGVRMVGGLVLVWIACKLLLGEEEEHEISPDEAAKSAMAAIRMIFLADFVMSLDNMLAVAGAAHGNFFQLMLGLLVSIGIIMTGSAFIARLMNRYKWIVVLGAGILAYTAAHMMIGDRELAGYFVRNQQVSLNRHWEDWMLTHEHVSNFDQEPPLPKELEDIVKFEAGKLTFIGQMTQAQEQALLARVGTPEDRKAIEKMYESSHKREVPGWVPQNLKPHVENWFQRKWPAEHWFATRERHYYYVTWVFCTIIVAICLTTPYWWPKGKPEPPAGSETPAAGKGTA